MKLFKKVVDERQELEMIKIERGSFWVVLATLLLSIFVQLAMGANLREIAGEYAVLIIGALYLVIRCLRSGHWDYHTKPGMKTYFLYSLAGGVLCALFSTIVQLIRAPGRVNGAFAQMLVGILLTFAAGFGACFVLLFLTGTLTKRRRQKLAEELDDDAQ